MNAICSFIGIHFNAKNRPHITLTKEEAKVIFVQQVESSASLGNSASNNRELFSLHRNLLQDMFKRLVDAVPEVKFELYSFKSTIKCKEMLEQDCWFENKV